jgi:hypothetical protein
MFADLHKQMNGSDPFKGNGDQAVLRHRSQIDDRVPDQQRGWGRSSFDFRSNLARSGNEMVIRFEETAVKPMRIRLPKHASAQDIVDAVDEQTIREGKTRYTPIDRIGNGNANINLKSRVHHHLQGTVQRVNGGGHPVIESRYGVDVRGVHDVTLMGNKTGSNIQNANIHARGHVPLAGSHLRDVNLQSPGLDAEGAHLHGNVNRKPAHAAAPDMVVFAKKRQNDHLMHPQPGF